MEGGNTNYIAITSTCMYTPICMPYPCLHQSPSTPLSIYYLSNQPTPILVYPYLCLPQSPSTPLSVYYLFIQPTPILVYPYPCLLQSPSTSIYYLSI